jgi:hypothetical protein
MGKILPISVAQRYPGKRFGILLGSTALCLGQPKFDPPRRQNTQILGNLTQISEELSRSPNIWVKNPVI